MGISKLHTWYNINLEQIKVSICSFDSNIKLQYMGVIQFVLIIKLYNTHVCTVINTFSPKHNKMFCYIVHVCVLLQNGIGSIQSLQYFPLNSLGELFFSYWPASRQCVINCYTLNKTTYFLMS